MVAHCLLRRYHPWALQVADVDGRGQAIAIGVSKPTQNLHFPHRTLFLVRFDGKTLTRKWTASTMGRPLLEFAFAPGTPQRLLTLERTLQGEVALSTYHWVGFGFRKDHQRIWHRAERLRAKQSCLCIDADGHQVSLQWKDVLQ